jgi:hypothetical protein
MHSLKNFTLCAALLLLVAGSHRAWASSSCDAVAGNLIQNCGFETGSFAGWTQTGNTDPTQSYVETYGAHSGTYGAVLGPYNTSANAPDPDPGYSETLSQTFADTAGQTATFSFWLQDQASCNVDPGPGQTCGQAGGQEYPGYSFFQASADSTQLLNLTNPVAQSGLYTEYSYTFTTTGLDTISFTFQNDPSYFLLDDVTVSTPALVAATPEPSSLILLGTGVTALAGAARRRFARG